MITPQDEQRSFGAIRDALCFRYNDDAFERVIYSESHDEVASGKARVPQEINPNDPKGWYAQKHSTLAAALVSTAPGIPMLFQGQDFLEGGWFRDTVPLDWDQRDEFRGIVRLYRDLIRLRMRTLAYHEAIPGHHFQTAIQQEIRDVPFFRRVIPFAAYSEGWALYAARLAAESGFQDDPFDRLGYLSDQMLRAVRPVVDTGIHTRRWSREEAIRYMHTFVSGTSIRSSYVARRLGLDTK